MQNSKSNCVDAGNGIIKFSDMAILQISIS